MGVTGRKAASSTSGRNARASGQRGTGIAATCGGVRLDEAAGSGGRTAIAAGEAERLTGCGRSGSRRGLGRSEGGRPRLAGRSRPRSGISAPCRAPPLRTGSVVCGGALLARVLGGRRPRRTSCAVFRVGSRVADRAC